MNNLLGLVFFLFLIACVASPPVGNQTISQGIQGKVEIREGNLMPGPDRMDQPKISPQKSDFSRELYIYEPTSLSQVTTTTTTTNGFYTKIQTKLITKVLSQKDGSFQVALKPGKYSLFSKEPKGFYANQFNGEGYIFLVEVKPNEVTPVAFVIDYKASY